MRCLKDRVRLLISWHPFPRDAKLKRWLARQRVLQIPTPVLLLTPIFTEKAPW
ncbi:hypothetical protein Q31a_62720 [Aureliella helgolandensis]|uniref:Uncharacterized protein n=1 Tax=Aureliella helgolandensis TaxID=2527968 RepID=A0A518GH11_9BACT|nr:hypothetical protein Q31a_62720 [Aureliella helgolandensis]